MIYSEEWFTSTGELHERIYAPHREPEALDGVVVDLQNLQPPAIDQNLLPPVGTVAELVQDQPGHRGIGSLGEFHPHAGKVMDGERPGQDQGPSGSWRADAMSRSNSS